MGDAARTEFCCAAEAEAAERERERVVAWLRRWASASVDTDREARALGDAADAIERGAHWIRTP